MLKKNDLGKFRKEVEALLKPLTEKYKVNIRTGRVKASEFRFNLDLEVSRLTVRGRPLEQVEFEKFAGIYGFEREDYNRKFEVKGQKYSIIGFNTKAKTIPVIARGEDGEKYMFRVREVKLID